MWSGVCERERRKQVAAFYKRVKQTLRVSILMKQLSYLLVCLLLPLFL